MSGNRRIPGIFLLTSFLTGILLFNSCKKDPTAPAVTTGAATEITTSSATISGEVTGDGGAEITARGICWGTATNPTIEDEFTPSGTGTGTFSSTITGLGPNTFYYARAYAENSAGISYGNEITFTTGVAAPEVTTSQVSNVTPTGATCGGIIIYNGGSDIIARGVCWSTSPNPDLEDSFTTTYTGSETFVSTMAGLLPGTKYYVRAYIRNSSFTAYGEQITFNTKVADIQGNIYGTVTIGNQVWMTENLKTTMLNDNTDIPNVPGDAEWIILSTPGYCWARNEIQYKDIYGALYNWYTVNTGKLCPGGWHVPSDEEYKVLEQTLGMASDQLDLTEWRGTDQGARMKNTSGWADGENGTNSSGFSALPGGYRWAKTGAFNGIGMLSYWWSSEYNTEYAWYRRLDGPNSDVYRFATSKEGGKYVRCVKD
jgi:uncharacterized protein (TIGR02145 family)